MFTQYKTAQGNDVAFASHGFRTERLVAPASDFAATEFLLNEFDAEYGGFAPTRPMAHEPRGSTVQALRAPAAAGSSRRESDAMMAAWDTARWVEEMEALAADAVRRAKSEKRARRPPEFASIGAFALGGGWLARLEAALERALPASLGTLLALFICVSLSMALISSILPIVDRL